MPTCVGCFMHYTTCIIYKQVYDCRMWCAVSYIIQHMSTKLKRTESVCTVLYIYNFILFSFAFKIFHFPGK